MSDFLAFMPDAFIGTAPAVNPESDEQADEQSKPSEPTATAASTAATATAASAPPSSSSSSASSSSLPSLSGAGGWWGSVLSSVLQSSEQIIQQTKRDLSEFVHVIQHDTQQAVAETAHRLHQQLETLNQDGESASSTPASSLPSSSEHGASASTLRESTSSSDLSLARTVSHLLGSLTASIASAAAPAPAPNLASGSSSAAGASVAGMGVGTTMTRSEAALHALQVDTSTYTEDIPPADQSAFKKWLATFVLESQTEGISHLLSENAEVRSLHARLVPSSVSYTVFWQRYFFRVHQLREQEARRAKLKEKMEASVVDEFKWDDEEPSAAEEQSEASALRGSDATHSRQLSDALSSDDEIVSLNSSAPSRKAVPSMTVPPRPTEAVPAQSAASSGLPSPLDLTPVLPHGAQSKVSPTSEISASFSHALNSYPPASSGGAPRVASAGTAHSPRSSSRTSTDSFEFVSNGSSRGTPTAATAATSAAALAATGAAFAGAADDDDDWESWE